MAFGLLYISFVIIFKHKIRAINEQIIEHLKMTNELTGLLIAQKIHSLTSIYNEINDYNRTYWSKHICNVWSLWGLFIVLLILYTYISKLDTSYLFTIILFTVSGVNYIFIYNIHDIGC